MQRELGLKSPGWGTRARASFDRSRKRRGYANCAAACLAVLLATVALCLGAGLEIQTCFLLGALGVYVAFNEFIRVRGHVDVNQELAAKVRQLLDSRRAAGLKRLAQDVPGRLQSWPRPPYSYNATVLSRFNADRAIPLQGREVDYRSLACEAVEKVVELLRRYEDNVDSAPSSELRMWLMQRLMHEGPSPETDPELFKELHCVVDMAERRTAEKGFFCRLCLAFHVASGKTQRVELACGKCLCGRCARELVEGVLDGRVRVPVACPAGNCQAVLTPKLVEDLVPTDDFEKFQRMHLVKMSLDKSAPHKGNLGAQLAQARAIVGNGPLPAVMERQGSSQSLDASEQETPPPQPQSSTDSFSPFAEGVAVPLEGARGTSAQNTHTSPGPRAQNRVASPSRGSLESCPRQLNHSPRSAPDLSCRIGASGGATWLATIPQKRTSSGGGVSISSLLKPITDAQAEARRKRHDD